MCDEIVRKWPVGFHQSLLTGQIFQQTNKQQRKTIMFADFDFQHSQVFTLEIIVLSTDRNAVIDNKLCNIETRHSSGAV